MSNKTQLQTNNIKYASLIETLRGKAAGGSGEDVTNETNAYTTKLASLETAVAALESELAGKASGGSQIGTFMINGYELINLSGAAEQVVLQFIVGQTWQEWVDSLFNIITSNGLATQKIIIDNSGMLRFTNLGGMLAYVSIDGTASGRVSANDVISNGTTYANYVSDPLGGWE